MNNYYVGFIFLKLVTLLLLISGCSSTNHTPANDLTLCPDNRPEICTMEYDPVCAKYADGSWKTYPSACNACSDKKVIGHRPGACE